MGYKNVINLFRLKIKPGPVNLIRSLTLIKTGVDKDLQVIAFDMKTRAGNGPDSSKEFQFHFFSLLLRDNTGIFNFS
jgi:hypothetical protein